MLAVDQQGQLVFKDETVDPVGGPQGPGIQKKVLDDWSGGTGLARTFAGGQDPTADRSLHVMSGVVGTGTDGIGGGLDPRFGGLLKGPRIRTPVTVLNGSAITRLVEYTPSGGATVWVAAVGTKVYKSTSIDWTSGVSDITPTGTANEVLDLAVASPRKGSPELRIALRDAPTYSTSDATPTSSTWVPDGGATSNRVANPLAVYRWNNASGVFEDGTAVTTDGSLATALDISSLPTTDYVLVGYSRRTVDAFISLGSTNSNAVQMRLQYRTASGWANAPAFVDLTESPAGTSLGQTGDLGWAAPATWVPAVLATSLQGEELYFVKLDFPGGALDGSVTITAIRVQYRHQIDAIGVVGATEVWSAGGNTFLTTEFGGADGAVSDTSEKYATRSGEVIGAVTMNDTVYFRKTDGLYTVDAAGKRVDVFPEGRASPASSRTGQALGVWDNAIWFASDYTLRRLTADGELKVVGPERTALGDATAQYRATALCGDRDQFLMVAFRRADGTAVLGAYRTYRLVGNQLTGVDEWVPQDAWSIGLAELGTRTITSMAVFTASGQPWLVMGASDGRILASKLAVGFGPPPEFTDVDGEAVLPSWDGFDGQRAVHVTAATVRGRDLSATKDVKLYTKAPNESSYTLRATFAASGGAEFSPIHNGFGVDVKIRLRTDDHAVSPHLDVLGLRYRHQLEIGVRQFTLVAQAHEGVRDRRGAKVRRTAGDWGTAIRSVLAAEGQPMTLVTPSGWSTHVLMDSVQETVAKPAVGDAPSSAFSLVLSTTA